MLVLARKPTEKIVINNNIIVTVIRVNDRRADIGIEAPMDIPIVRYEVLQDGRKNKKPRDK